MIESVPPASHLDKQDIKRIVIGELDEFFHLFVRSNSIANDPQSPDFQLGESEGWVKQAQRDKGKEAKNEEVRSTKYEVRSEKYEVRSKKKKKKVIMYL